MPFRLDKSERLKLSRFRGFCAQDTSQVVKALDPTLDAEPVLCARIHTQVRPADTKSAESVSLIRPIITRQSQP